MFFGKSVVAPLDPTPGARARLSTSPMDSKKPGGRAGLRQFAFALHVASSVVCALRALFKNDLLIFTGASARKFLVSRAWSCVVRRIPSGKLSSNLSRVASLFGREERFLEARFPKLSWKFPWHMITGAALGKQLIWW